MFPFSVKTVDLDPEGYVDLTGRVRAFYGESIYLTREEVVTLSAPFKQRIEEVLQANSPVEWCVPITRGDRVKPHVTVSRKRDYAKFLKGVERLEGGFEAWVNAIADEVFQAAALEKESLLCQLDSQPRGRVL